MDPIALLLLFGGLLLVGLGVFAWPVMQNLPSHRARASVFGSATARRMVLFGGLVMAAVGGVWFAVG